MAGKFILRRAQNGDYFFSLIAGNGENVGRSELYRSRAGALNGIDSVKANSPNLTRFVIKPGRDGKHYLSLKAGNGEVILTGQGYASMASAQKGCAAIARAAMNAPIVDETVPETAG